MIDNLLIFTPVEIYVAAVTLGLFIILQLYYTLIYARPSQMAKREEQKSHPAEDISKYPPISIIIYAKNDSDNLRKHLPVLLTQDYPTYEVIVINDGSTDDTDDTLKYFKNQYKHLYHTYIPADVRYVSRRKLALTLGIKASKYDILLFTESNCQPVSEYWLSSVSSGYKQNNTNIVLGYCKYGNYKGLGQKLIAYDNLLTGLRYLSLALSHAPYTGNGRNLSYRKELFFHHKGYYKSLSLHAGDDDLFVNEAATKENTSVIYTPDSLTEMDKINNLSFWKEMKMSRAATGQYYRGGILSFFHLESLLFFLFIIVGFSAIIIGVLGNWLISVLGSLLLIIRFVIKAVIFHKSARMLGQQPLTGWLLVLEFIQPIFDSYIYIHRFFRRKKDYTFRLNG